MQYIYFTLFFIGFIGLASSFLFGDFDSNSELDLSSDISDASDSETKVFSLRTIFAFLLSFSIGASLSLISGNSILIQTAIGVLSGLILAYGTFKLTKLLYKQQASSNVSSETLIGKKGIVVIGNSKNSTNLVKVHVDTGYGETEFIGYCENVCKVGDIVKIVSMIGNRFKFEKQ